MPETGYLVAALIVAGVINVALRGLPFLALRKLRESEWVQNLGIWLPAGILTILALSTFVSSAEGGRAFPALVALVVTVIVHLVFHRHSLLSIGAGTLTFVALVNWV